MRVKGTDHGGRLSRMKKGGLTRKGVGAAQQVIGHDDVDGADNEQRNDVVDEQFGEHDDLGVVLAAVLGERRAVVGGLVVDGPRLAVDVGEEGAGRAQRHGQHPNGGQREEHPLGLGPVDQRPHRIGDGQVPVGAERRQREDGHADGGVARELGELAQEDAERPRFVGENGARERHRHQQHQQVADGQVEDERVGNGAHGLVPAEDDDQTAVADHAHDEDQREHHRHDVRLRTQRVRHVGIAAGAQGTVVLRVSHCLCLDLCLCVAGWIEPIDSGDADSPIPSNAAALGTNRWWTLSAHNSATRWFAIGSTPIDPDARFSF